MVIDINLALHPELINPNLKMKDAKKILKNITGINEENQIYQIVFYFNNYEQYFWNDADLLIYDQSKYKMTIKRETFEKDIILDLTKKVEALKEMVLAQTQIAINRQKFFFEGDELTNDKNIKDVNLFKNDFFIKISKKLDNTVYIKYPNSEKKEIKTDLYNTGFEFLEQILSPNFNKMDFKYYLYFNNKNINLDDMLILAGVKNGDLIELIERKTFPILIKKYENKIINVNVGKNDTIKFLKYLIYSKKNIPITVQKLSFNGKELEGNKTLDEYGIKNDSILELTLRLAIIDKIIKEKEDKEKKKKEEIKDEKIKKEEDKK